jgi:hypothetical protein
LGEEDVLAWLEIGGDGADLFDFKIGRDGMLWGNFIINSFNFGK